MMSIRKGNHNLYLLICLVGLLPFMVLGILRHFDLFEFIELKTLDGRLQLLPRHFQHVSDQISLITIDDKSEAELGSQWLPDVYTALLYSLQSVDPTAIGLMMWFNREEWDEAQLLPSEKLFVNQLYSMRDSATRYAFPEASPWIRLPRSLTHAQSSFSWFPLSRSDGIYRAAQLVVKDLTSMEGNYRYSLEMAILCQTYGIDLTSIKMREGFWRGKFLELPLPSGTPLRIPIDSQGRLFIRFVGDESTFHHTSFVDALNDFDTDVAKFQQKFEGKNVLIGITTAGTAQATTPTGKMSALALRANLLNTLLNQDFIWQLSRRASLLYFICLAILSTTAAVFIYRFGHGSRAMLLVAGVLLLLHLLFVLGACISFNIWIEVTASSLAIVLAGGVNSLFLSHLRLRSTLFKLQTTQEQLVQSEKEAVFGVMSAQVRHELRNALNLIRGPAEIIRNNFQRQDPLNLGERPAEIVEYMDEIIGSVTKFDDMIENELSFFQNTELDRQPQALEPIIHSALDMTRHLIDENQIRVKLNLPAKTLALPLDADKMRIVFANLVKNACQAMPQGGTLEITAKLASSKGIIILVQDTGVGIPTHEQDGIFEPFHTTKPRGLGLGLVNVKNIVERHDGTVYVKSKVGVGTTFFIELPYQYEV
ncbi:CHASE2 domain-containing protein [Candidatus Poribacteria bacterium]|nr:CHASE2 domain-containing protein [Candidatus Poribacteria bacterium]